MSPSQQKTTEDPPALGDASPTHYLIDDPQAESPSDPWRYGFTRRRFVQGGAAVALGCAQLSHQLITSTLSFRPAFAQTPDTAKTWWPCSSAVGSTA